MNTTKSKSFKAGYTIDYLYEGLEIPRNRLVTYLSKYLTEKSHKNENKFHSRFTGH